MLRLQHGIHRTSTPPGRRNLPRKTRRPTRISARGKRIGHNDPLGALPHLRPQRQRWVDSRPPPGSFREPDRLHVSFDAKHYAETHADQTPKREGEGEAFDGITSAFLRAIPMAHARALMRDRHEQLSVADVRQEITPLPARVESTAITYTLPVPTSLSATRPWNRSSVSRNGPGRASIHGLHDYAEHELRESSRAKAATRGIRRLPGPVKPALADNEGGKGKNDGD